MPLVRTSYSMLVHMYNHVHALSACNAAIGGISADNTCSVCYL